MEESVNALGTRKGEIHSWIRSNLFDSVPMAISVISRDFRVLEANRPFEKAFGPWKERPCYKVYKDRKEPCLHCAALETFVDGQIRAREEVGVTTDGREIDYLVHMVPVLRPNGEIPFVIEMSTDITAVKSLEREKREADRLAAVGETVAGVAHGIKNILMGLEGGMYAVNSGIESGDDDRVARGWTTMQGNIERISTFMREFLDFAKGRTTVTTLTDPAAPAREVLDLYRESAERAGIRLVADIADNLGSAPLDEEGIHTGLANLVSNAIDACLVAEREPPLTVTLSAREEDDVIIYEVRDDGQGMDYEVSRKVFSKFFTTKGSDRGTGLGLLTTKRIVHEHGGRISFTSKGGEGSVFRIELPRSMLPEPGPRPEETPHDAR